MAAARYSLRLNSTSHKASASWWHQLVLRARKRRGKLKCGLLQHVSERVRVAVVLEVLFLVCLFVWCLGPKPRNTFFGRQHKVCVVCVVAMGTACSPQLHDCAVRCNLHTSCSILFRLGGHFYTLKVLEGGKHFSFFCVLQLWLWSNQSKTKHTHPSISWSWACSCLRAMAISVYQFQSEPHTDFIEVTLKTLEKSNKKQIFYALLTINMIYSSSAGPHTVPGP